MRRLLAVLMFGFVLLVAMPAAQADDYPPRLPGSGVYRRAPAATPPPAAISQQQRERDLARTGNDATREVGIGVSLVLLGGASLAITRRRRAAVRG
jgi:hypothetical protein